MGRVLGLAPFLFLALSLQASVIEVEGPQDSLAGPPTINHCTLRKAIINANTDSCAYPQCPCGSGVDTITFLTPMTITFSIAGISEDAALTGDLDITDSLIINGHPGGTTIDGADLDRIFDIKPGVTVTLNDLHLTNGTGLGSGGAILMNGATLNLNRSTISASHVNGGDGGAILATGMSTLNIDSSTISGNSAAHHGGAIVIEGGTAAISNTTITNNSSGFANLTGGIRTLAATTLRNTIVAGNAGVDNPNLDGTFTSLGYNIIGELGTNPGNPNITASTGDQFDVPTASLHLGALANNGGPTPTHALLAGSVALDQGHSGGATMDQRGLTRPCDAAGVPNAPGGDGADVGAFEEQVACSNTAPDAVDDNANVSEDSGANVVNVLTNDTDANADTLTVIAATQGAHGSVTFTATNVSYTPDPNFFGADSFTYTIDDGHGGNDTATVHVTVANVNDAPVATGDAYLMNQDTTLNVAAPGVLVNDSDIDGDTLHAILGIDVAHGTLHLHADGSFDYTPNPGYAGTDSFTYTANDASAASGAVTVTIQVADTQPPSIMLNVATATLWPPNHKFVDVGLSFGATDNASTPTVSVAVYSDEPGPDAYFNGTSLLLRAERDGNGDGRVYLIRVTATDASNNTSSACTTVTVPKSQSAADIALANAQAVAAQSACSGAGMVLLATH